MHKIKEKIASQGAVLRRANRLFFDKTSTPAIIVWGFLSLILSQAWIGTNYLWGQTVNKLVGQPSIFVSTAIIFVVIIYFGYSILVRLLSYVAGKKSTFVTHYLQNKIERLLWRANARLDVQDRENIDMQNAIADARQNYSAVTNLLSTQWSVIAAILTIGTSIGVIVQIHWWFFLIIFAAILPKVYFNRNRKKRWYLKWKRFNEVRRYQDEVLSNVSTKQSKIHDTVEYFLEKYESLREKFAKLRLQDQLYNQKIGIGVGIWGNLLTMIIYYSLFSDISNGAIAMGSLFIIQAAFTKLESNLDDIMTTYVVMEDEVRKSSDFFFLLDAKPAIQDVENPIVLDGLFAPIIEFDNVWFKYPETDEYILKGVSFCIKPGETLGLVGHNGSGKTTLSLLLLRFYDPTEGSIRINGIDLRIVQRKSLFAMIGCVFQSFNLFETRFNESIYSNNPHIPYDHSKIVDAAVLADIDEKIRSYEDGYEQKIGRIYKKGTKLSGGQAQKMAIAGVVYRNPKILILDELTSALDPMAEASIIDRYKKVLISDKKTAMVICQRLKSLELVDRIIMLDKGVLIEEGTHTELMALNGQYATLFHAAQINL